MAVPRARRDEGLQSGAHALELGNTLFDVVEPGLRCAPHLGGRTLRYAGRPWSASPASGSKGVHESESRALIDEAFGDPA